MRIQNITSTKNEYIKSLKRLQNKKAREESGLFIAEGVLCAEEALMYAEVEALLLTEKYAQMEQFAHGNARALAEEKNVQIIIASDEVMSAVCTSKNPQGAAAVVRRRQCSYERKGLLLFLEDVSDPQNIGTMIRTADAMGAGAVVLSSTSADCYSASCVRATMGSIFHIPVIYSEDFYAELSDAGNAGMSIIAGHLKGKNALPKLKNAVVLIGNETRGLTERASSLADVLYRIPMFGKAESLNAAIAAGIMMHKASEMIFMGE